MKTKRLIEVAKSFSHVIVLEKKNHLSFISNGKTVAYTKGDALVVKLDPKRIEKILSTKSAKPLIMGGRTVKGWIVTEAAKLRYFKEALLS